MRSAVAILGLIASMAATGCASLHVRGKPSAELIAMLEAPKTHRGLRKAASDQLRRRPPADVLPGVFAVYRRHASQLTSWSSRDLFAAGERVSWQEAAGITAAYAWSGNLENPAHDAQKRGAVLLELLSRWQGEICSQRALSQEPALGGLDHIRGLSLLLQDLQAHWTDGAEGAVRGVLTNAHFSSGCRLSAADTLVRRTGAKHFAEILAAAEVAAASDRHWFARLLLGVTPAPEWEARVLRFAVATIEAERAAHPDSSNAGYFIASAMEHHAGKRLTPEVVSGQCCPPEFFRATVDNALAWWAAHQDRFPVH